VGRNACRGALRPVFEFFDVKQRVYGSMANTLLQVMRAHPDFVAWTKECGQDRPASNEA
jgi:hypothetical protein